MQKKAFLALLKFDTAALWGQVPRSGKNRFSQDLIFFLCKIVFAIRKSDFRLMGATENMSTFSHGRRAIPKKGLTSSAWVCLFPPSKRRSADHTVLENRLPLIVCSLVSLLSTAVVSIENMDRIYVSL